MPAWRSQAVKVFRLNVFTCASEKLENASCFGSLSERAETGYASSVLIAANACRKLEAKMCAAECADEELFGGAMSEAAVGFCRLVGSKT